MRIHRLSAALGLALLFLDPAFAQAPAAPAADDDASTLETIVVKGEKTDRPLQETTTSVAVTTAERIEQENLLSLYDILNRTANVAQMYGDRGFSIRGIGNEAGAANPLATVYLDGAALPSQVSDSGPFDLWDIDQIEILRGPQSTIQGENALAGAIVLRSADPTPDWSGKARLLWSDPSDRRIGLAFGGPLIADELAFRIAVENRDFDGFIDNPTRGDKEDARESTLARATVLWTPTALPGLTARLSLTHDDRDGPYMYTYSRRDVADFYDHRINLSDHPSETDSIGKLANLQLDYDFGNAWSLASVTSWTDSRSLRSYDIDGTPEPATFGNSREHYDTLSQELRLHYAGDRLRGLVGVHASRRDMDSGQTTRAQVTTPVGTIAAVLQGAGLDPATAAYVADLYAQALPVIDVDYTSRADSRAKNHALFSDVEFDLSPRLALLGGFRYDKENYRLGAATTAAFAGTLPDPALFGEALAPAIAGINQAVLGMVQQAGSVSPAVPRDFTAFLPKAGLRYAWTDAVSTAFVVQRGYRSGGSSYNIARAANVAYDPEFTTNYELSLRAELLDGRLTLNANAYYIDWTDKQVSAFFGLNEYDYHTVNAGEAHLYGFELEASHRPSDAFDWYVSLGHSRTRYDDFKSVADAQINDWTGAEFAYAPRWTGAVGGNLRWSSRWFANLNANYRSSVTPDIGVDAHHLSSRTLLNARLGYQTAHWTAYVFGNNLLDEGYIQFSWDDTDPNVILGAPRVVGVGFETRW